MLVTGVDGSDIVGADESSGDCELAELQRYQDTGLNAGKCLTADNCLTAYTCLTAENCLVAEG